MTIDSFSISPSCPAQYDHWRPQYPELPAGKTPALPGRYFNASMLQWFNPKNASFGIKIGTKR
jgi:hypothetical protein